MDALKGESISAPTTDQAPCDPQPVIDQLATLDRAALKRVLIATVERLDDRVLREWLAVYELSSPKESPKEEEDVRVPIVRELFFFARHPEYLDPSRFLIANFFRQAAAAYELTHREDSGTFDELYDHIVVSGCPDCCTRFERLKGPLLRFAIRNASQRWAKEVLAASA